MKKIKREIVIFFAVRHIGKAMSWLAKIENPRRPSDAYRSLHGIMLSKNKVWPK